MIHETAEFNTPQSFDPHAHDARTLAHLNKYHKEAARAVRLYRIWYTH